LAVVEDTLQSNNISRFRLTKRLF